MIDPMIAKRDNGDAMRVWSVGCATGEKVYTLGMLLLERIEAVRTVAAGAAIARWNEVR